VEDAEMLRTFNLGVGMVAVIGPDSLETAREVAAAHNVESWPIGRVEARAKDQNRFDLVK
jgi:phosphoribosylformylglycinamidine cyclo-ligase